MSREAMDQRFGRQPASPRPASPRPASRKSHDYAYTMAPEFAVEAFIETLVERARHELDPNSLMYLTRAVDYFDLEHEYGGLDQALKPVQARLLFVSYRDDWRYPAAETERMHRALTQAGGDSTHRVLDSPLGHGAFLFDVPGLAPAVTAFLDQPRA
jgi:homoserine O-acetyltransferase